MISSVDQLIAEVSPLWAPPPRQTVCEWAGEHFIVATGANKGRLKAKANQVEPINAIGDARISSLVIMSATQMLKTITILVGTAYVIARDMESIASVALLEVIMRRHERPSTLLTSNRLVEDWGELLSDVAAVSAMLDRLPHHGHVLKCGPRSWRIKVAAPQ